MSVTGGDGGAAAAAYRKVGRRRRRSCGGGRWSGGGAAVATISGGGACVSRAREGRFSGGAYGFVRAPFEACLVSTASSRREEHDDGLGCTRFATVKKLWSIY